MAEGAVDGRPAAGTESLTVEQFAAETGLSVRTVRSYRSRRLLPPPVVRSGVAYYGDEHIARVRRILELQAQGLTLSEIARLVAGRRPSVEQLAELSRVISAPFETDVPEVLSRDQLAGRVGPLTERDIDKARKLGLLVAAGDGMFEVPSPRLLQAVAEVVGRGVPVSTALSVIQTVRRNCETISTTFVQLFVEQVWAPFDESGQPTDRWHEVTEAIERLRLLASEVLLALFKQTMEAEVERAFGEIVEEQSTRGTQPTP